MAARPPSSSPRRAASSENSWGTSSRPPVADGAGPRAGALPRAKVAAWAASSPRISATTSARVMGAPSSWRGAGAPGAFGNGPAARGVALGSTRRDLEVHDEDGGSSAEGALGSAQQRQAHYLVRAEQTPEALGGDIVELRGRAKSTRESDQHSSWPRAEWDGRPAGVSIVETPARVGTRRRGEVRGQVGQRRAAHDIPVRHYGRSARARMRPRSSACEPPPYAPARTARRSCSGGAGTAPRGRAASAAPCVPCRPCPGSAARADRPSGCLCPAQCRWSGGLGPNFPVWSFRQKRVSLYGALRPVLMG